MVWWTLCPVETVKGGNRIVAGAHLYIYRIPPRLWQEDSIARAPCIYPIFKIGVLLYFHVISSFKKSALMRNRLGHPKEITVCYRWAPANVAFCSCRTAQWRVNVLFLFLCLIWKMWHLSVCIHVQLQKCLTFFHDLLTSN